MVNFRFTSALRSGIKFAGTEKITLGGGQANWLFINKVKIIDFVSTGTPNTKCFYIDLSPAANAGGGTISPEIGIIDGGACTNLASTGTTAFLELKVGKTCFQTILLRIYIVLT